MPLVSNNYIGHWREERWSLKLVNKKQSSLIPDAQQINPGLRNS